MHRLQILLSNARNTKDVRSIMALSLLTFALFIAVALLLPTTCRVLRDNRLDDEGAKYAGIVAEITARDNLRGTLFDRAGRVIAETVETEDGDGRQLYYKESAAHLVGTLPDKTFGSYGAEYYFNALLVGVEDVNLNAHRGNDVYLTADMELQETLYGLLAGFSGAAVVTDCKTGAVLAMVSTPSYDPSAPLTAEEAGRVYTNGEYVNIAMSALTPGSVFKLLSTVVLTDNGYTPILESDNGAVEYPGLGTITNAFGYVYENVDIIKAIEKSSNVYFSRAVYELCSQPDKTRSTYADGIDALGMSAAIPTQFGDIRQSNGVRSGDTWELLQSSFGQGQLLVSPLFVNVFVSAAVTDGRYLRPYFLLRAVNPKGKTEAEEKPEALEYSISRAACETLRRGMQQAADDYGLTLHGQTGQIYAKTGTAEISATRNNVWLTCAFPADDPQYAVTMVKIEGLDMSTVLLEPMQQLLDKMWNHLLNE